MKYNPQKLKSFIQTVNGYYLKYRRVLLWRKDITPYRILVSEVMLQQTQVSRVSEKFPVFLARFPDFNTLAKASNLEVLRVWQGMGYNRRGLYLKRIAEEVVNKYHSNLPRSITELDSLPGIGPATAASIAVYAFNLPAVFIETNIRRVFIHHFFRDGTDIEDGELIPLVEQTLDREHPREWYYALMDYGTYLGKTVENPNRRSRHYSIQPPFEGSDRQLRGSVIRLLLDGAATETELYRRLPTHKERIRNILHDLEKEGFLQLRDNVYSLK